MLNLTELINLYHLIKLCMSLLLLVKLCENRPHLTACIYARLLYKTKFIIKMHIPQVMLICYVSQLESSVWIIGHFKEFSCCLCDSLLAGNVLMCQIVI